MINYLILIIDWEARQVPTWYWNCDKFLKHAQSAKEAYREASLTIWKGVEDLVTEVSSGWTVPALTLQDEGRRETRALKAEIRCVY